MENNLKRSAFCSSSTIGLKQEITQLQERSKIRTTGSKGDQTQFDMRDIPLKEEVDDCGL